MQVKEYAFFALVFLAVLAVGLSLSAAEVAQPPFTVCTNNNAFTLAQGASLTVTPAQLDPTCPIATIRAAILGHVPGSSTPQLQENAVTLTVTPTSVVLTSAAAASGNPDETAITIPANSIAIFG